LPVLPRLELGLPHVVLVHPLKRRRECVELYVPRRTVSTGWGRGGTRGVGGGRTMPKSCSGVLEMGSPKRSTTFSKFSSISL
jgi:hypothetical protein